MTVWVTMAWVMAAVVVLTKSTTNNRKDCLTFKRWQLQVFH